MTALRKLIVIDLIFHVPVLLFDGKDYTDISLSETALEVSYKGHKCLYVSEDVIEDTSNLYANRNGHYKHFVIKQKDNIVLYVDMQ